MSGASISAVCQRCREIGNDAFRKKRFTGTQPSRLCFRHAVVRGLYSAACCQALFCPPVFQTWQCMLAEAVELYTQAILAGAENNAVLFSNRSAAYLARHMYSHAMQNAASAIELDPTWPKAFHRQVSTDLCFKHTVNHLFIGHHACN